MRIPYILAYIARRIAVEKAVALRGVVYLSFCVAALVSFAVLMPSLEYQHVRGPQEALWDVWLTGPLSSSDLAELEDDESVDSLVPALTLTVDTLAGPSTHPDRTLAEGAVTAIAYRRARDLGEGPYPESLLLEGRQPKEGEWACDWSVARRFGLDVGDIVTAHAIPPGHDIVLSGRLAGIYGPTGTLRDTIALPASSDLVDALTSSGGAPWTDAFVTSDDPERLAERVATGKDADRILAIPRMDLELEGRTRILREAGPFLRSGATWVALGGFAALALWQQSARLARRRHEYAILTALGAGRALLVTMDASEQALRLGAVAVVGTVGALALVEGLSGMYVPRSTLAIALLALGLAILGTLVVGAASVSRRLRRTDVSDDLARE